MDILTEDIAEDCIGAVGGVCNEETTNEAYKCEPCLFDNSEVKATSFCVDCYEQLCFNCARDHRKNKILRNHKILEGEVVPERIKALKDLKRMMVCPDHPETDFTFKCEDHDTYICIKCLAQCHLKCNKVNEIQHLPTFGNADMCGFAKETLSQIKEDTGTAIKKIKENKETLRTTFAAVKTEQHNVFDKIYEQLSKSKAELELETNRIYLKELNDLEQSFEQYKEVEEKETHYQRLLEVTQRFGNAMELTVIPDVISQKAKQLKGTIESRHQKEAACLMFDCCMDLNALTNVGKVFALSPEQAKHSEICDKYSLTSDEILEPVKAANDTLKVSTDNSSSQCSVTKHIDTNSQHLEHDSLSKGNKPDTEQKQNTPSLMKRTINHRDIPYTARCADDTLPCDIFSIVILPTERLVCIDNSNRKLKVFEEDFSLSYAHHLQNQPYDMCHVDDTTVAIAFSDVKEVKKYFVGQSHVSIEGKFPFSSKFQIAALAKFGSDKIAILLSDDNNTADKNIFVQIRDASNGKILKTFDFEKILGVKFNFEDQGVNQLLCRESNEILVSGSLKLHCFDIENSATDSNQNTGSASIQESWFYRNRKKSLLDDISDLAADEEGNIYICCSDSKNVHQIAAHDYRENRILIKNITNPLSISVNSKKECLIVACEEDDYLHVYDFN